jgi:hypothetical protein
LHSSSFRRNFPSQRQQQYKCGQEGWLLSESK